MNIMKTLATFLFVLLAIVERPCKAQNAVHPNDSSVPCAIPAKIAGTTLRFLATYPEEASPAIRNAVENMRVKIENSNFAKIEGKMAPYCNDERCFSSIDVVDIPDDVTINEPTADITEQPQISRRSSSVFTQLQYGKNIYKIHGPKQFLVRDILLIFADATPHFEYTYNPRGIQPSHDDIVKNLILPAYDLKSYLQNEWKYDYYVVIATKNVYFEWMYFFEQFKPKRHIVLQISAVGGDPIGLVAPIIENYECSDKFVYQPFILNNQDESFTNSMARYSEENFKMRFAPVVIFAVRFECNPDEFTFYKKIFNETFINKLYETLYQQNKNIRIAIFIFKLNKKKLESKAIIQDYHNRHLLLKELYKYGSFNQYKIYHSMPMHVGGEHYMALLNTIRNTMPNLVVKPMMYLMMRYETPSMQHIAVFDHNSLHYAHKSFKKYMTGMNMPLTFIHDIRPVPIDHKYVTPADVLFDVAQHSKSDSASYFIESINHMVETTMAKDRWHRRLNREFLSAQMWNPLQSNISLPPSKKTEILYVVKDRYDAYNTHVLAKFKQTNFIDLIDNLKILHGIDVLRIQQNTMQFIETDDDGEGKCHFQQEYRNLPIIKEYAYPAPPTPHKPLANWTHSAYSCIQKYIWRYPYKVILFFESEFTDEMAHPRGIALHVREALRIPKIFIYYGPEIKYDVEELKKSRIYLVNAKRCADVVLCVTSVIADIFGHSVPIFT